MLTYEHLRPLLFQLDPEFAHAMAANALGIVEALPTVRRWVAHHFSIQDPRLEQQIWGVRFPNPVGLAAGFDKDGRYPRALAALGFGFIEVGTVTAFPQPGNEPPRLFRLAADAALLNRMGFNNHGSAALAERLRRRHPGVPLGINIGKSKVTPNEEALADYLTSLERVHALADYLVVNVSSPNTPGLRALQERGPLQTLLAGLQRRLVELSTPKKPLLLKIAPDLSDAQIDDVLALLVEVPVEGIVATNTTIARTGLVTPVAEVERLGAGGISGRPLRARSNQIISRIFKATQGRLPIIGVGGVFTAEDAAEKIEAGASLVQLYTGFVYGGPSTPRRILEGLRSLMQAKGIRSLSEWVGASVR